MARPPHQACMLLQQRHRLVLLFVRYTTRLRIICGLSWRPYQRRYFAGRLTAWSPSEHTSPFPSQPSTTVFTKGGLACLRCPAPRGYVEAHVVGSDNRAKHRVPTHSTSECSNQTGPGHENYPLARVIQPRRRPPAELYTGWSCYIVVGSVHLSDVSTGKAGGLSANSDAW